MRLIDADEFINTTKIGTTLALLWFVTMNARSKSFSFIDVSSPE